MAVKCSCKANSREWFGELEKAEFFNGLVVGESSAQVNKKFPLWRDNKMLVTRALWKLNYVPICCYYFLDPKKSLKRCYYHQISHRAFSAFGMVQWRA